jgi:hypothetical protein
MSAARRRHALTLVNRAGLTLLNATSGRAAILPHGGSR